MPKNGTLQRMALSHPSKSEMGRHRKYGGTAPKGILTRQVSVTEQNKKNHQVAHTVPTNFQQEPTLLQRLEAKYFLPNGTSARMGISTQARFFLVLMSKHGGDAAKTTLGKQR